jgi:periplasmic divalent cation tolerance protein
MKLIYVTCPHKTEALAIIRTLLDERLVACGNILDGMTSIYRWNGAIQEDSEVILILKTSVELAQTCADRVRELHSYEVPCIISWNSDVLNPDYAAWLAESLRANS